MSRQIPIRCFQFDPSVKSSLAFLRKTPWARAKVEKWYAWEVTLLHKAERYLELQQAQPGERLGDSDHEGG